jgi:hypothetical protein
MQHASCTRVLAVQVLLSQLIIPNSNLQFPLSLIPIYKFFFPNNNVDFIWWLDGCYTPSAEEIERMTNGLLNNSPLINLTTLAQAVHQREHAPPPSLSFIWNTLDMLLTQPWTIHPDESSHSQSDFDNLHDRIRSYVHADERGFRIRPLLDKLDTFARGRRLLILFSAHAKYRNRADVVFRKEFFRSRDFLEAFACCLPNFIRAEENTPEVCRDFMEKVVRHDDLWTSLQVNLEPTQWLNRPSLDKLRVFEDCCTVLDLTFSVLEDSREVNWCTAELGSLSHHFESFIQNALTGTGRATSFRLDIISARFRNALIAQFSNDAGTTSVLSQWHVAFLARVICALGLRDDEDPEFWMSYTNGGRIGTVFMAKVPQIVQTAARDGPLLIFSQLGLLVAKGVPLEQSGLELEDINKALELQRKVTGEKTHLLLNNASNRAWEALGQLLRLVEDLHGEHTGTDRDILQRLLQTINDVNRRRVSG